MRRPIILLMVFCSIKISAWALPVIHETDFGLQYLYFSGSSLNSRPANKKIDVAGTDFLLNKTWQFGKKFTLIGRFGMGSSTLSSDQLNYDPPFSRKGGMVALGGGLKYQFSPDHFLDAQFLFIPMNPGLEYEYIVHHAKYGLCDYSWLEFQLSAGLIQAPFYFGLRYSYLNLLFLSVTKQADQGYESLIADLPESFDPASSLGIFGGVTHELSKNTHFLAEISLLDEFSATLGMGVKF